MKQRHVLMTALAALWTGACALGMGGPSPVDKDAMMLRVSAGLTADQLAQALRGSGVQFAILTGATRDSAWYADAATRAGMTVTRPARIGAETFAFMGPKAVGDTTLGLKVQGGGELRVHDALYKIDKHRYLDLMAVHVGQGVNLRESVRSLLSYVATDVMANAALLFVIETAHPAQADSIAVLTRAAFGDVWECTKDGRSGRVMPPAALRAFYGPASRMKCTNAEPTDIGAGGIIGHFVLPR